MLTHLNDIGWPVIDSLQTFGYQAHQAIKQELLFLKDVESNEQLSLEESLELIDSYLNTITHAPERKAQDIQVLGLIESLGLHFTDLWICEMDSENFPSRYSANVFLPQGTKSQYRMPRATQREELRFSQNLLKSWSEQSSNIVFSYSCRKGDATIAASPLILEIPETLTELSLPNLNPDFQPQRTDLIANLDNRGSNYPKTSIRGGTRMLKDQINCGFKSFAINRLGLEAPEAASDFPGPLEKGIVVHEVLARLFAKRYSKQSIESISDEETKALTKLMVEQHFKKAPDLYKDSEIHRISNLIKTFKTNSKYLIISITPYTFIAYLFLLIFRKKVYLYLWSDGHEEWEHLIGKWSVWIFHLMYLICTFKSEIIVCNKRLTKKKSHLISISRLENKWFQNLTKASTKTKDAVSPPDKTKSPMETSFEIKWSRTL